MWNSWQIISDFAKVNLSSDYQAASNITKSFISTNIVQSSSCPLVYVKVQLLGTIIGKYKVLLLYKFETKVEDS